MNYEDIPLIENVRYLRGYDLLIKFANGEERIVDMSESFEVPRALKYAPVSVFKNFSFNSDSVWWGDEDWIVGHDSIYNMSILISPYADNAIKLAFDYLNKGIWSLFGGPFSDSDLIHLLTPYDSESLPDRPALDVSEARKDFILSEEYSTALLHSSGYDLTIDADCLKYHILWLNDFTFIPKSFCVLVYSYSLYTEEDFDLANNMYETFVLAVNRLRHVLGKIHNGEIPVNWKNGIVPDPWLSIPVPTPLDYTEVRIKDKLSELFDRFVDEMDLLAVQISDMVMQPENNENVAYRTNCFSVSEVSCHIEEIQGLIELIRSGIKSGIEISLEEYKARVKEIDSNSKIVRLANAYVSSDKTKSETRIAHHKEMEKFISAYRILLLEFNSCVILYNQLNKEKELRPLASVDVSPLIKV